MYDIPHRDIVSSIPMSAINEVLTQIKTEYQTALSNKWVDINVPQSGITQEWLEGLTVGSGTRLIGDDNEDVGLSVLVYEMNVA